MMDSQYCLATNDKNAARIRRVTTEFSAGVSRERSLYDESARQHDALLESCRTASDYYENSASPARFDYANFLRKFGQKQLRVLDVGVGPGGSSVFLATCGHSVVAVEPSAALCRVIATAAEKFRLDITAVITVGEDIDRIGDSDFDVVVFNSSLHHYDDPMKVLCNAFQVLKPGGSVFLCSELQLHPWVRKARWYKRLETHAVEMGHYGGNEHAYYSWEYRKMLRDAGFINISMEPLALSLDPLRHIEMGITTRIQGKRMWNEWRALIRTIWYITMARIIRFQAIFRLLLLGLDSSRAVLRC